MAFSAKQLEFRITLGRGEFASQSGSGGGNTKIIRGLAAQVRVDKSGLPSKNAAQVSIHGMLEQDMEQLTTLSFRPLGVARNTITAFAGDEESGLHQVFSGDIIHAAPDYANAPEVPFRIEAMTGYLASLTPARPLTFDGQVDAVSVLKGLASDMGLAFTANGPGAQLADTALNGSPLEKARSVSRAAGLDLIIDDGRMIVSPTGQGNGDTSNRAVLINKENGLIGYPSFTSQGVSLRCDYVPQLRYGGLIKLETRLAKASGFWRVIKLVHALDTRGGLWQTEIEGVYAQ